MKKNLIKMITLVAFSTVLLSSCSMEYRQNRRKQRDNNHQHDHDHDDHHYSRY